MKRDENRVSRLGIPDADDHSGMNTLRTVLRRLRDDEQGGYHNNAGLLSTGLTVTLPELDILFQYAGIVRDPIVPKGSCGTCRFVESDGRDRGWKPPCVSCWRPVMSNWEPKRKLKALGRRPKCGVNLGRIVSAREKLKP